MILLGKMLADATKQFYGVLHQVVDDSMPERYHTILLYIHDCQRPVAQNDLIQILGCDKATITRMVHSLLEDQWLERSTNPEDRRSWLLSLSPKSQAIMPRLIEIVNDVMNTAFKDVAQDQRDSFIMVLDTMAINLRGLPSKPYTIQLQTPEE